MACSFQLWNFSVIDIKFAYKSVIASVRGMVPTQISISSIEEIIPQLQNEKIGKFMTHSLNGSSDALKRSKDINFHIQRFDLRQFF